MSLYSILASLKKYTLIFLVLYGIFLVFYAWSAYRFSRFQFSDTSVAINLNLEPTYKKVYFKKISSLEKEEFVYELNPLSDYKTVGEVVGISQPSDDLTLIAPIDLSLAWGKIIEPEWRDTVSYSNKGRVLWRHYNLNPHPMSHREIAKYSTNNHLIASNQNILSALEKTKKGDLVAIEGTLVDVSIFKNGINLGIWTTSMDPDDYSFANGNACEIIYIKKLRVNDEVFE